MQGRANSPRIPLTKLKCLSEKRRRDALLVSFRQGCMKFACIAGKFVFLVDTGRHGDDEMASKSEALAMEEVHARFDQWRKNRARVSPILAELWSAAVEVARSHGIARTAATLHLNGGKLKRIMGVCHPAWLDRRRCRFVSSALARSN